MSQHPEYDLISAIVSRGEMDVALDAGINTEAFQIVTVRQAWKFLLRWYKDPSTWGLTPSPGHFVESFPKFPYSPTGESTKALCQRLIDAEIKIKLVSLAEDILERVEGKEESSQAVLQLLADKAYQLSAHHGTQHLVDMASAGDRVLERLRMAKEGAIPGIPWMWPTMNFETGGKHPGDWIVLYARPKMMKTWLMIADAEFCYTDHHQRVLFYTREMTPEQIMMRTAMRMARVNYTEAIRGRLCYDDEMRVARALDFMKEQEGFLMEEGSRKFFYIVSDRGNPKGGGVTSLMTMLRKYQPSIVYVDGVYLMRNDRSGKRTTEWSDIQQISQDLKDGAMTAGIPFLGTMQENKRGQIAYADVAQDVDLTLNISKILGPDGKPILKIRFPESRETIVSGIAVQGLPAQSFEFLYPLTEQADEEDERPKGPPERASEQPRRDPVRPTNTSYMPNIVK